MDIEIVSDKGYEELFEDPDHRHLGSRPDASQRTLRIHIGDNPRATNLRVMMGAKRLKECPALQRFLGHYEVWVLEHSVGVVGGGILHSLRELAFRVEFPASPQVVVLEMFPETAFSEGFSVGIDLRSEATASVSASGDVKLTESILPLAVEGSLSLVASAVLRWSYSFKLLSPRVVSIGTGDRVSEWIVRRNEKPLLGTQQFIQVVLAPHHQEVLKLKYVVGGCASGFFCIPIRLRSSEPIEMCIDLKTGIGQRVMP